MIIQWNNKDANANAKVNETFYHISNMCLNLFIFLNIEYSLSCREYIKLCTCIHMISVLSVTQ